jgi:hypothetical protein
MSQWLAARTVASAMSAGRLKVAGQMGTSRFDGTISSRNHLSCTCFFFLQIFHGWTNRSIVSGIKLVPAVSTTAANKIILRVRGFLLASGIFLFGHRISPRQCTGFHRLHWRFQVTCQSHFHRQSPIRHSDKSKFTSVLLLRLDAACIYDGGYRASAPAIACIPVSLDRASW